LSDKRPVVVTGVSTGIGRAIAKVLVEAGIPVFGSVRNAEDANAFEAELGNLATALQFDLRDEAAIAAAAERVRTAVGADGIAALVNNAGGAFPGPLEDMPLDRFREQLNVGVTGTLAVTQAFLPLLCGPRPGRIVNISSVSGATAMPFLGAYAAAKFGLEALSDSLRRELMVHGVDVIVIQPAGVVTPIWQKAAEEDASAYAGTVYEKPLAAFHAAAGAAGRSGLPAEAVGRLVLRILGKRRPRARYLITRHPLTERVMRLLPARLLDRLIARRLGLTRSG
jgi:NAD(P)-dependent dehydrogenase (short-subunit alcohol dehydrogenase family)